jgi:FAD/FMN-containing dehydrogenase
LALTRDQLKRQHPLWDAFWRSRNELDPNRVFANDFTRSLDS